jgi:hypothetical protein
MAGISRKCADNGSGHFNASSFCNHSDSFAFKKGVAQKTRRRHLLLAPKGASLLVLAPGESPMLVRYLAVVLCFALCSFTAVKAEDPVANAQAVISGQIAALMQDDAEKAYSFASPGIRSLYPNKDRFLDMVRKTYEPVYHAGNYAFGRSKMIGGGEVVLQEVMISAREGKDWTAIYEMRLMDDGSYKVNGVRMIRNTASQGI